MTLRWSEVVWCGCGDSLVLEATPTMRYYYDTVLSIGSQGEDSYCYYALRTVIRIHPDRDFGSRVNSGAIQPIANRAQLVGIGSEIHLLADGV